MEAVEPADEAEAAVSMLLPRPMEVEMPETLDQISRRVDRLERENRWLRRTVCLLLVPLAGLVLLAATGRGQEDETAPVQPSPQVTAQRFVLVDASGHEQAVLGTGANGAFLHFLAPGSVAEHPVPVSLDSRGLTLSTSETTGVALTDGGLTIVGSAARTILRETSLSFRPAGTRAEARIGVQPAGPAVRLRDVAGGLAVLGVQTFKPSATAPEKTTDAAALSLVAPDHRLVWNSPGLEH